MWRLGDYPDTSYHFSPFVEPEGATSIVSVALSLGFKSGIMEYELLQFHGS